MRRDDLREPDTDTGPPTLEDALRVPDLDDREVVRSLWDDLAEEAVVVEPSVREPAGREPWFPAEEEPATPAAEPEPAPVAEPEPEPEVEAPAPLSRKEARRQRRLLKEEARLRKLEKRRHRILPRSVIGIASMLLFFGLGVGVAGAVLYAYYDWRLSENEQRVGELSESLERRLLEANEELDLTGQEAINAVRREAAGLRQLVEDQGVVADLTGELQGRVWFVETLDENGAPSVGSAFVAASDDAESLLVTSYSVVAAGTTEPAPTITVRSGEERLEAELYNWDPEHDLALLILPRGGLESLPWAGNDALSRVVGRHVWAVEGIGGNGVSLSPGTAIDQTEQGLQHTAPLNAAFRGGPIVNGRGRVVGIASTAYAPLNYPGDDVAFAVPIQAACQRVLTCSGDIPG